MPYFDIILYIFINGTVDTGKFSKVFQ